MTRYLPPACSAAPFPVELDHDIWRQANSSLPPKATRLVIPSRFLYPTMASHVLLAACRQEELAFETVSAKNEPCGAFSNSLMEALQSCIIGETTYSDLIIRTQRTLRKQHPQCEGINKDRFLFNTSKRNHPNGTLPADSSDIVGTHHNENDLVRDHFQQWLVTSGYENNSRTLDSLLRFYTYPHRYEDSLLDGLFNVQLQRLEEQPGVPPIYTPTGDNLFAVPIDFNNSGFSDVPAIMEAVVPCSEGHELYYGLTLENRSQFDLFPYVFYFNPALSHPRV
jgi:hypothetical protein